MKWAFFLVKGQNGRWIIQKALHVLFPLRDFLFVFWQEGQAIVMRGWRAKKDREGSKRESLNFQIKPGRKRKLSLIFILYPNKLWNRVMLKNRWRQQELREKQQQWVKLAKNNNNFACAAHFFVHFFVVVLHDYNMKLPETSLFNVLWRKFCVCSCSLYIFHCCLFLTMWPLAFLIFSPRAVKY